MLVMAGDNGKYGAIGWEDEFIGPADIFFDVSVHTDGSRNGAHNRRADSADVTPGVFCRIDGLHKVRRDCHLLGVHTVFRKVFDVDFAEVAKPEMEGKEIVVDALYFHYFEDFAAKVQTCRRGNDGYGKDYERLAEGAHHYSRV